MIYLFISDLHLSPKHPRLIRGFLDLLAEYQHKNTQLYILGDWFNTWIGDDHTAPWLVEIVEHLKNFTQAGNQVYFLVGNRDFALTQQFLQQFQGQILPEITYLTINNKKYRLEHGDLLCTDDVKYQKFRKIIRNPILLNILRKTPLKFREKLATGFQKQSHQAKKTKSYAIMDVNQNAVDAALSTCDVLIHGHTHRPMLHTEKNAKQRIVLGDWRENTAQIVEISDQQTLFKTWTY